MGLEAFQPSGAAHTTRILMRRILTVILAGTIVALPARAQRPVPTPASIIGFTPGADRHLAGWDTIVRYFRALDAASPRVSVRQLGWTTDSVPFIVAFISSPQN